MLDLLAPLFGGLVLLLSQRGQLDFELRNLALDFIDLLRQRVDRDPQPRGSLVDQVDRLVGQEPVGDIAMRQRRGRDQRVVGDANAVMDLVLLLETTQNRDRVLDGRLAHVYGLPVGPHIATRQGPGSGVLEVGEIGISVLVLGLGDYRSHLLPLSLPASGRGGPGFFGW